MRIDTVRFSAVMGRLPPKTIAGFLLTIVSVGFLHAGQFCEFRLPQYPEFLNGDTVVVPESVSAVSESIPAIFPVCAMTDMCRATTMPSIVFIIDQSGRMSGAGQGGLAIDQWGVRYRVIRDVIDSAYLLNSLVEVGLVPFSDWLCLDGRTTDSYAKYLKTLPSTYDSNLYQSYKPLCSLNQVTGCGFLALKDILAVDTVVDGTYQYADLKHRPLFLNQLTHERNINIAFTAAKEALKAAANPAYRQFVVFITGGLPSGTRQAGLPPFSFVDGAQMPTTFTFCLSDSAAVPESLVAMTENIRNNGYSINNPMSNVRSVRANYDELLKNVWGVVRDSIIVHLLMRPEPFPTRVTINGIASTTLVQSSAQWGDFVFPHSFPLQSGYTHFQVATTLHSSNDAKVERDTIVNSDFYVNRTAAQPPTPGITISCRDSSAAARFGVAPSPLTRAHRGGPMGASALGVYDLRGRRIQTQVHVSANRVVRGISSAYIVRTSDGLFGRVIDLQE